MFFEYPDILWLEILPALLLALYVFREWTGRVPHMRVSTLAPWKKGSTVATEILCHLPMALLTASMALLIFATARPRSSSTLESVQTEGIDIVLTMDVSTSMLARDFSPDRLNAAKDIAIEFIAGRPTDRMAIVVFAGESYTQCPLTTDRAALINMMKEVQTDLIEDGTAIGDGLATAVARIKDSDAKSRVVILMTDGVNNCGSITPETAAQIAKEFGIRVYTIGVGANGTAPYPVMTPWGPRVQDMEVKIDEDVLKQIASLTGGRYFRATDKTKLAEIYAEIGKMETSRITVDSFPVYKELYENYALVALVLLLLYFVFEILLIRRLP